MRNVRQFINDASGNGERNDREKGIETQFSFFHIFLSSKNQQLQGMITRLIIFCAILTIQEMEFLINSQKIFLDQSKMPTSTILDFDI